MGRLLVRASSSFAGCLVFVFLILHRMAPGRLGGDWSWTPASGARKPGAEIVQAAVRELEEEAELRLSLNCAPFARGTWATYLAKARPDAVPALHDPDHERVKWASPDEAIRRSQPAIVSDTLQRALSFLASQFRP